MKLLSIFIFLGIFVQSALCASESLTVEERLLRIEKHLGFIIEKQEEYKHTLESPIQGDLYLEDIETATVGGDIYRDAFDSFDRPANCMYFLRFASSKKLISKGIIKEVRSSGSFEISLIQIIGVTPKLKTFDGYEFIGQIGVGMSKDKVKWSPTFDLKVEIGD